MVVVNHVIVQIILLIIKILASDADVLDRVHVQIKMDFIFEIKHSDINPETFKKIYIDSLKQSLSKDAITMMDYNKYIMGNWTNENY